MSGFILYGRQAEDIEMPGGARRGRWTLSCVSSAVLDRLAGEPYALITLEGDRWIWRAGEIIGLADSLDSAMDAVENLLWGTL